VIRGKPPDSIREAMQTMPPTQRSKQEQLMQQALLADRFKLKAHFESRDMPVYELIVAKGGPRLKESPDLTGSQVGVNPSGIRGKSVPMHNLIDCLENVPDIGGRVVIDTTGFPGATIYLSNGLQCSRQHLPMSRAHPCSQRSRSNSD
jgi:uncharacterized protein (TIGR03435 family)